MEAQKSNYTPLPTSKFFKDLTRKEFGDWTVIGYLGKVNGNQRWECRCKCGNIKSVQGGSLTSGASEGCGCASIEATIKRNTTHGMSDSPEYSTLQGMIDRCYNPNATNFSDYGGRGIVICDRWRFGEGGKSGFECFFEDMGPRPEGLTIDRRENNGNYEPENCRWTTQLIQVNNSRHNHMLTWRGKTQSVSDWARERGFTREALKDRIRRGWEIEDALTRPMRRWPSQSAA